MNRLLPNAALVAVFASTTLAAGTASALPMIFAPDAPPPAQAPAAKAVPQPPTPAAPATTASPSATKVAQPPAPTPTAPATAPPSATKAAQPPAPTPAAPTTATAPPPGTKAAQPPTPAAPAPTSAKPPAPLSATDASCPADAVDALVKKLDDFAHTSDANEHAAYAAHACDQPNVLCLDRFGEATTDTVPESVRAEQSFAVDVIAPALDTGTFAVSAAVRAHTTIGGGHPLPALAPSPAPIGSCTLAPEQRRALQTAAAPIVRLGARPGLESLDVPAADDAYWTSASDAAVYADWSAWAAARGAHPVEYAAIESRVDVPAGAPTLDVDFTRTERGGATPSAERHYAIRIDHGTYHLEAAVLVPFVIKGSRTATLSPTPNGNELRVGIDEDWHVTGAIALDFFPAGRQRGQISSFSHCRTGSCVENWLGLEVAAGLGSPLKEWYFGLVFEPVSGVAISAGAALLKGDFLAPGFSEGMLLPSSSSFAFDSDYMVRPYFGVTATTDIFETLNRGAVMARVW